MKVEEIERLLAEFYEGNHYREPGRGVERLFQNNGSARTSAEGQRNFSQPLPGCRPRCGSSCGHLGDKLSLLIDEKAEKEQRFFRPNNSKSSWRWIGGVAATILLLIGIGYGIDNLGKRCVPAHTAGYILRSGRSLPDVTGNFTGDFCQPQLWTQ